MATRRVYKMRLIGRSRGDWDAPDIHAAERRALKKFAPILQAGVREEAGRRVKNSPTLDNRGRRRYRNRMQDQYTVNIIGDGREASLTANTLRGRVFEVGARARTITARRGEFLWFRIPKPMGTLHRATEINHPGQPARPVMGDTLDRLAPLGERILDEEIVGA